MTAGNQRNNLDKEARRFLHPGIFFSFLLILFVVPGWNSGSLEARNRYYEALRKMDVSNHPLIPELIGEIRKKELWKTRTWLLLGHYKGDADHPVSEADDLGFFLAEDGKTNPQAELEETLKSYFLPVDSLQSASPEEQSINENYHPRCNFPARFEYLRKNLGFDPAIFPKMKCEKFNRLHSQVRARSASLMFASYYASDPASMFGHTLLRLDPIDPKVRPIAVNFSANTTGYDIVRYIVYGLFGGFKGLFSYIPYEDKIREYAFTQNRDIWEYELDLSPEEIEFIQLHIWELKTTGFDYFYMTENCSFRLLTLIELAKPELHLQEHFPAWVVPGETIRVITKVPGLVRKMKYIPSFRNRIELLVRNMSDEQRDIFREEMKKKYTTGEDLSSNPNLDPSYRELVRFVQIYNDRHKLLKQRPGIPLPVASTDLDDLNYFLSKNENPPEGVVPVEQGHELPAMGAGMGMRGDSPFFQYRIRPVMHGMENASQGYSPHTSLAYVDARVRYYPEDHLLAVHKVEVVKVLSLGGGDFLGSSPGFLFDIYGTSIYQRGKEIRNLDRNLLSYSLYNRWGSNTAMIPQIADLDQNGTYRWIEMASLLDDSDFYNSSNPSAIDLFTKRWREDYISDLKEREQTLRAYPLFRIDFMPSLSLFAGRPGGTEFIVSGFGGARLQADPVDTSGTGLFPAAGLQFLFRTEQVRILGRASATASGKRPDPEASILFSWSLDKNFEFMIEAGTDGRENEASLQFFAHY